MFTRLADLAIERRKLVLWLSGAMLAVMAVLSVGAFSVLKSGGFNDPSSDSSRASAVLDHDFGGQANLVLLLTPKQQMSLDSAPVRAAAAHITAGLARRSDVSAVRSYWTSHADGLRSRDGASGLVVMHVRGDTEAAAASATTIIDEDTTGSDVVRVRAGGALGVSSDITAQTGNDLALAESIAVPITLLLLVLAFGSLIAALLPLAIGLFAIAGTLAELSVLGRLTDVSINAINLTTALGLGLAIDFSLLMVNRFREELGAGADVDTALRTTVHTAGRTIVFSSAIVAVALSAMLIFPLYFLRSFAYAGIGVVLIALAAALITLPALLATLGTKVAKGRRGNAGASLESPTWRRIATAVMRRPLAVAVPVIGVLLALSTPLLHIHFGTPDDRVLHTSAQSRQVGDTLRSDYDAAAASAVSVVIQGHPSDTDIASYIHALDQVPGVRAVQDGPGQRRDGVHYLTVTGAPDSSSSASQTLVGDLRELPAPVRSTVLIGGSAAALVDGKAAIGTYLPWALLWIALTTFVLLFLFTGSVLLPIKALAMNALSLSAVFGVMVWIFQDGHLSGLLGFTPTPIDTSMPVLLFCIAFGLSMDYEVFLLSRIKELHDEGADTREAVAGGLARTGRIITTAAALLSVTFFAFGTGGTSFIQLFGIGTGIAIVLDATIIRGLLVPAFMRIAGEWNWWAPRPLRRLHQHIGLSENARPEPNPVPSTV
ncbi:MAG: MMPL family transporter [Jatrophihabitans sp.]